jgi:O-methyltransferase
MPQWRNNIIHATNVKFLQIKKKIYVYDSFQGLPKKEEQDKNNNEPNKSIHLGSLQTTKRNLLINFKQAKLKLPIIHKGWFKEVPSELFPKKIAFAFFDGDLYNSILESFKKTYTKVETGGIIVIDDYNSELFPGVKRATEDFLKGREIVDEIENQGIIIKK